LHNFDELVEEVKIDRKLEFGGRFQQKYLTGEFLGIFFLGTVEKN
jgi:hypothetical protein